jgi:cytochrome c553
VLALQVCSNCHGVDGNSVSPNFPNLAAQTEDYISEQLTSFRKHSRFDPAGFEYMWGLSRHLTDQQIKYNAAYFASQ